LPTGLADFNGLLYSAIEDTIVEVLGRKVFLALREGLETRFGVTSEELAYRTDTMYNMLEGTFGVVGAKTLGTHIAMKFYAKLGLHFERHDSYTLVDYVEAAKAALSRA